LNLFQKRTCVRPLPKSVLFLRTSLTKQSYQHSPSPTRAGEHNLLTTARSNLAATCVAAPFDPRFIYRTSFPIATACAPATFGLSTSPTSPSFRLAADDSNTHLATSAHNAWPMLLPALLSNYFDRSFRQTGYATSGVFSRSQSPLPLRTAVALHAF
jgi:hypothetical protein